MYADNTVLLLSDKTEAEINKTINHDANILHTWLCSNGLILSSNRGETEFMMPDTSARRKDRNEIIIEINSKPIINTDQYKYLGIHLDPSLSLTDHVHKVCKKVSSRLGLLRRIRSIFTIHATLDLYKAMVQPVTTYCSTAFLSMLETNRKKFGQFRKEQQRLYLEHTIDEKSVCFPRLPICRIYSVLFSCCSGVSNEIPISFERVDHHKATRVNGQNLKIPKVKTESTKRGFNHSGVKIYDALPTHLKTERFYLPFKQGLK